VTALRDADGTIIGYLLIGTDNTARKQVEAQLRQSNERIAVATESAGIGTWDWNMENRDLICSPEMHEVFGLDPGLATLDAEKWRRMLDPDDLKEVDKALAQAIEKHTEFGAKFRITRSDGAVRWLETLAQIFYNDNGEPARIVGISTDITERKEIEDRERKIAAEAMAADVARQLPTPNPLQLSPEQKLIVGEHLANFGAEQGVAHDAPPESSKR
jgi:PAS domain S-box-containing protein